MSTVFSRIKFSCISAQLFIFPSLLMGQMITVSTRRSFSWLVFILVHLYGLCIHAYIIYTRNVTDCKMGPIPNTSRSSNPASLALARDRFRHKTVFNGATLVAASSLLVSAILSLWTRNWLLFAAAALSLMTFQSNSFYLFKVPQRLSPDSLQMLGTGLLLPIIGHLSQGGLVMNIPWLLLLLLLPAQLSTAVSVSMKDNISNHSGTNRALMNKLGPTVTELLILVLYILSLSGTALYFSTVLNQWFTLLVFAVLILFILIQIFFFSRTQTPPDKQDLDTLIMLSSLTNAAFGLGVSLMLFYVVV